MRTKETLKVERKPTPDEVERELASIEEATLEEEMERKRRGLTQEPEAQRIETKPPFEIEKVEATRPTEEIEEKIKGEDVADYVKKWSKEKRKLPKSELQEIRNIRKVKFVGDVTVPLLLVDEILEKAKIKDRNERGGALELDEVFENLEKAKVIAYKPDKHFTIQVWDKDSNLVELQVGCDGKIQKFSKFAA